MRGRPTNTKEELQKDSKLDFPTPFTPYLHSPLIVPHILHVVLASQVITIAVLLANQRLLVFILKPVIFTFSTNTGFQLSFGNQPIIVTLTLQLTNSSGGGRISITLPNTIIPITIPHQAQTTPSLTSPTHSLVGNRSQSSNRSFETVPTFQRTRVNRQILNIGQALQGDYTGIETREEEIIPEHWADISNPLWMDTEYLEAYSRKY